MSMAKLQVGANLVLVGSKSMEKSEKEKAINTMPTSLTLEVKTPTGVSLGVVVATLREFKTGSIGYYAHGKVVLPG